MNLFNKYRPKTLDEVKGQDFVVSTLKNKIPHTLLFTSSLGGTGKTSTACILANELNAFHIEVDAASNNSVENVRNLIEQCRQRPLGFKNIFVTVDECSRYNKSTWDVFLKFIEQPPDYVYLCFCTTDLEKVPDTIRSRCTHFEFKPIDTSVIIDQLKYICNAEGKSYEDKAIELLAGYAKHSLRQAISNLELVFSQDITTDVVIKNVIKASYSDMMNLTFAYLDNNVSNIMGILNNISDMQSFIEHYFTFILDLRIFHKTSRMDLTSLPQIVYNDIREINSSEWEMIDNLCEELFHLQWEGKHSPVLKELFLSRLF